MLDKHGQWIIAAQDSKSLFIMILSLSDNRDSSLTIPVLTGLIVGIVLIALFAVLVSSRESFPVLHFFSPYANAQITLEGMKDAYSVGDSIDFSVTSKGYFGQICSDYYPMVSIDNKDTGEIKWSNFQESGDGSVVMLCNPEPHYDELTWVFGRNSDRNDFRNIVIDEAGSYDLNIKLDNKVLHSEFIAG